MRRFYLIGANISESKQHALIAESAGCLDAMEAMLTCMAVEALQIITREVALSASGIWFLEPLCFCARLLRDDSLAEKQDSVLFRGG